MYAFLVLFSLFGCLTFLILIIISIFTKKNRKRNIIGFFACFFAFVIFISITPSTNDREKDANNKTNENIEQYEEDIKSQDKESDLPDDLGEIVTLQIDEINASEEVRERALKVDSAIWDRVISAETNYDNLLTAMETTNSLYTLYTFCEDLESLMDSYIGDIGKISDENAEEYAQYAGTYINQIREIANHVKKYANKSDMKELNKAQDGMANLETFASAIVSSRFSYLSACGFSNDEIIEIGESFDG